MMCCCTPRMHMQASEQTYALLPSKAKQDMLRRGSIDVKGKGSMVTYLHLPMDENGEASSGSGHRPALTNSSLVFTSGA